MKKLLVLAAVVSAALSFMSCGSTENVTKLEYTGETPKVINHKGLGFGMEATPNWVMDVLGNQTNQKALGKSLGMTDSKIWVVYGSGPNLEFLRTWIDQVDARAEIASSIQQTISDKVKAVQEGSKDGNSAEVKSAVERVSSRLSLVTVSNLEKNQDWWTLTRRLKAGGNKKNAEDYIEEYNYLVIYSMPMDSFEKQMKDSLNQVLDGVGTEMSQKIRELVMDEITESSGVAPKNDSSAKAESAPATTTSTATAKADFVVYSE